MGTVLSSVKYTPNGVPYHELNDFKDLQRLDSGGYGIVFKGYSTVEKDGVRRKRTVAVKTFLQSDEYSEREILILKTHSHPNVVEIFGVIWDGQAIRDRAGNVKLQYSGYVMEYMELGSLHKEIHDVSKTYDIGLAALWIRQIGSGIQFLHENYIIHRDIKPENILLAARDHLKLADFGLARNVSGDRITSNVGTQCYRAPEVLTSNNYDERADVFSFGVTIWEIFHRKSPWEYLKKDSEGNVEPIIDSAAMEGELSSLVKRCWQEPSTRPSIEEITAFEPTFDPTIVVKKEGPIDETVVVNRSTSTWDTFTDYLRRVLSSVKYTPNGVPYHRLNDFKDLQRLDSGGYGIVYKGCGVTLLTRKKRTVAVKVFYQLDVYAEREIEILKKASHPHIVELFGVIWDGEMKDIDGTLILLYSGYVMEYMELGSLHKEIHNPSKEYDMWLTIVWIEQIGSGLQYLHEHEILHRDIKPKNILLATRTHLKLADFGLARNISLKNTYTSGRIGSDPYMAPEVIPSNDYGVPADVYSFGVTIWEIICRKYPSKHQKFENGCMQLPIDIEEMSEDSWNFVKRCWQRNISDRPSIQEIIDFAAKFVQTIFVVVDGDDNNRMAIWNRGTSTWTVSRMELPDHILCAGVVYLDDELYLINRGTLFFKLDKNMEWKQLADMNEERWGINNSCLGWNGYIWVFGGEDRDSVEVLKSVERYDPKEDKWTRMPDMKYVRCDAAAAVCNRKIYICGGRGYGFGVELKSMECFDPESGVWTELTDMPTPRYDHSLVCYRNKLVVIGGWNGREGTTVLELDPFEKNGQWNYLSPLTSPSHASVGVVLGREIITIGWDDTNDSSTGVKIFDGINWRVGPSFPHPLYFLPPFAVLVPQEFADRLSSYPID